MTEGKIKEKSTKKVDIEISAEKRARQLAGLRPFQPGQSGNPAGRPAMPPEVKEALMAATLPAARRLAELINSNDERIALMASETVLSRIFGKPTQSVENDVRVTDVAKLHLQHLQDIQARREERMKVIEGGAENPDGNSPKS